VDGVAASRSEVDVRPTDRHGVRQRVSGQFHQHSGDYWRQWLVMYARYAVCVCSTGPPRDFTAYCCAGPGSPQF